MPIDETNKKWACEACLRGHRATRCEHFDRWMMRVNKPGRPLDTCPHVNGDSCGCGKQKVIMMMIPKHEQVGNCNCRKVRDFDPAIDDEKAPPPPLRSTQQHNPSNSCCTTPSSRVQPDPRLPQPYNTNFTTSQHQPLGAQPSHGSYTQRDIRSQQPTPGPSPNNQTRSAVMALAWDTDGQDLRPKPSNGPFMQHAIQSQQPTPSPSPNDQTSSAVMALAKNANGQDFRPNPSYDPLMQYDMQLQQYVPASSMNGRTGSAAMRTMLGGLPIHHHEQSHIRPGPYSTPTVQDNGVAQQVLPDTNGYSSIGFQPIQSQNAELQQYFPPYNSYKPIPNNGQGSGKMSNFVPGHDYSLQDSSRPSTLHQQAHFEKSGWRYNLIRNRDPFSLANAAMGPSSEFDASINSQNCSCGPDCNCVYCRTHPFNPATVQRVQELAHTLDNYWDVNPDGNSLGSRPQSAFTATPTNGTNIESVMRQGHASSMDDSLTPSPFEWMNVPNQSPAPEPTFDGGDSVDRDDQFNESPSRTMRNSQYYTMAYPVIDSCTNTSGTCLCNKSCTCFGCLTHEGHFETQF